MQSLGRASTLLGWGGDIKAAKSARASASEQQFSALKLMPELSGAPTQEPRQEAGRGEGVRAAPTVSTATQQG